MGFHLAKLLSYESQDITLIDIDKRRLNYAVHQLDIRALKGDATSISVLLDAQVESSDLVIGVTASETTNITLCMLAKQLGSKKTIARISNPEFLDHQGLLNFDDLGIDELISPEELAATEIGMLLSKTAFNETYPFEGGLLNMVGFVLRENMPFIGNTVQEVAREFPDLRFMPIALLRRDSQYTHIPRGDTLFKRGDQVYIITDADGMATLQQLAGQPNVAIKNVMVLGGSRVGLNTAKDLCAKSYHVKLIEKDANRALELADEIPNALVINADGRNVELLEEENLGNMDAFVAVTGNSETNIMSCLVARSKNVPKTIAMVENMDYFQISQSIGINTLINKKLIAANTIFRYVRKGEVVALTRLNNLNTEILEFEVKPNTIVTGAAIRDLKIPRAAVIGGVIREGKGIIALGGFVIRAGDRVVVSCLPEAIPKIEKLFH